MQKIYKHLTELFAPLHKAVIYEEASIYNWYLYEKTLPPNWPSDILFTPENIVLCSEIQKRIDRDISIWAQALKEITPE